MQSRKPPRKCAWCQDEIPEGIPFERVGDRLLHVPCSNELELRLSRTPIQFRRQNEDENAKDGARP